MEALLNFLDPSECDTSCPLALCFFWAVVNNPGKPLDVLDEIRQNESDASDDASNRCNFVKGLLDKLIEIVRVSVESGESELNFIIYI